MNDPGVDQPVSQVADDLEGNPYEKEEKLEKEEEEDFLDPRCVSYPALENIPDLSIADGGSHPRHAR